MRRPGNRVSTTATTASRRAEIEARIALMLDRVKGSGLKLTSQRLAIVRELAADPTHPTAQELFERLRASQPAMSFATVYNTLDALTSAGLCAAMSVAPGASRFDPNMVPHHHAVCDRCGLVRDVPQLEAGPAEAASPAPGFQVRAIERIYRGVCEACSRAEGKEGPRRDAARLSPNDFGARKKRRRQTGAPQT